MLEELDQSYRENNYYKLYREVFEDFKKMSGALDYSISTTKLQLLIALDALKRNYSSLYEVNEKKKKAIKKALVRDFIKTTKISLCITSPSTARTLGAGMGKVAPRKSTTITSAEKAIPDKIVINTRDEKGCIHERFAIIRELAASNKKNLPLSKLTLRRRHAWKYGRNGRKILFSLNSTLFQINFLNL